MGFYRTLLKALLIDPNYNVGIISGQLSDCQNYTEYVSREENDNPKQCPKKYLDDVYYLLRLVLATFPLRLQPTLI